MNHDSNQPTGLMNCVHYDAHGTGRPVSLDEVPELLGDGSGFIWLGLHEPDEALLDRIQEMFGLHELAIEDAQKAHQRPKIEAFGNSLFVAVHTAQRVEDGIGFGETHVFVGVRYLITVRHGASLSHAAVRARCEQAPGMMTLGPSFALYAVLDYIVDNYQPIVRGFQDDTEQLESAVFEENYSRDTVERLYRLKRDLMTMRLAVVPMQDILSQLVRLHPNLIRDEVRLYFRDVADHTVRINEATDAMREMLSAALSVHLSLVTIHQGEIVKQLAGWAALAAIPTLVTGWYGMNFAHMPELSSPYGYVGVVAGTGLLCFGVYRLLKRAGWL
ncbi:MAG: magnesium and cobalt transport protein CorA [Xanthomonadales bacterium]|nr:magnesium and cobalt transport protein CorA [Xanthomonadales bacterium]